MEKFEQNCVNECCESAAPECCCDSKEMTPEQQIQMLKSDLVWAQNHNEESHEEIRKLNLQVEVLSDLFSQTMKDKRGFMNNQRWMEKRLNDYRNAVHEIHGLCMDKIIEAKSGKKLTKEFREFIDEILAVIERF